MNHLHKTASAIAAAILLTLPVAVFAEDVSPQAGNSTTPPSGAVTPTTKMGGQGGSHPILLRGTMSSSTFKEGQEGGMKGGRMMASDTRALPQGVTGLIEDRDKEGGRSGTTTNDNTEMRGRMMGTTSRNCVPVGSSTDCAPRGSAQRERIGEHRAEIFKHTGEMLLRRMEAAVERFTKIADRIDSRIQKMKAGGTDTTSAGAALLVARTKISDAGKAVKDAENVIDTVATNLSLGTSTLPSENEKKPAKDALEKARGAILAAAQSLNDVMPLLMGNRGQNSDREYASSTAASGTPKIPNTMRTKDRPMSTTTSEHTDSTL